MQYNTEQQEAILHFQGPALVLAGPGSGKTAVITGRIQALIRHYHVSPSQILVLTFTRAAAREMEERFRRENGGEAAVTFGTIHAICYRILRVSRPQAAYSVISQSARRRLLREVLSEAQEELPGERLEELEAEILKQKAGQKAPAEAESALFSPDVFARLFESYEARRQEAGLLDFEDLLKDCLRLLEDRRLLAWWQERFPFLLVDEFQDVNELQYRFIQTLAGEEKNLFAVGDEDQTIYGFRGARQQIILGFPKEYPEAGLIRLKSCYRCSPQILEAAGHMIRCNRQRFAKQLVSLAPAGPAPELTVFPEKKDELNALAARLKALLLQGQDPAGTAVLARTRFGLRQAAAALLKAGLELNWEESPDGDYQTQTARDLFAYLRLAGGGNSREDYLRIINRPLRYLPRRLFAVSRPERETLWQKAAGQAGLQEALLRLFYDLDRLKGLRPFAAIEYIRREMGYEAAVLAAEKENSGGESVSELLDRLQEESALYATAAEWEAAREALKREQESPPKAKRAAVHLMTMHGAKGLEFDAVFLPGLNEGVIPGRKVVKEEEIEAERRLLYVAMTRARKILWMSFVTRHRGSRLYPSRFLKETGLKAQAGPGRNT